MDGQPTHQIIDGYGIRWEVLCGRDDWQTAHCDITKTRNPCPDCLALMDLATTWSEPMAGPNP
jgi:hypothetical protein